MKICSVKFLEERNISRVFSRKFKMSLNQVFEKVRRNKKNQNIFNRRFKKVDNCKKKSMNARKTLFCCAKTLMFKLLRSKQMAMALKFSVFVGKIMIDTVFIQLTQFV